MKRIISLFLAFFLVLGMIPAIASAAEAGDASEKYLDVGDHNFTEVENNNTTSYADRIYNDYTVAGRISSTSDMDYFKFTASSSSTLILVGASSYSSTRFALLDSSGSPLKFSTFDGYDDGNAMHQLVANISSGTYYIAVYNVNDLRENYVFYISYSGTSSHTHSYTAVTTAPTCKDRGYTKYTCSCGEYYYSDYTDTVDHSYYTVVTYPTCQEGGYTQYICSYCNHSYNGDYTNPSDHTYVILGTTSDGKQIKECSYCGYSVTAYPAGWFTQDGNWYYRDNNGNIVTNQWRKDSYGWCYLGSDGAMKTNCWLQDSKGWCYIGANGYCETNCWKQDSYGTLYLDSEGSMAKNTWVCTNGKWYYLGADGYMVTNEWRKDSKGWCFLGNDGAMKTNCWLQDSKGWCYIGADGYCETNCWKQDSQGWIYLDSEGSMTRSKWVYDNGLWFYCDMYGYMVTGTQVIDGAVYIFDASGVWVS